MADWSRPRRLAEFVDFYERVKFAPESVSDAEFVRKIICTFWATNCWSFVEQAFAVIAPGYAMRPHLAREIIAQPIEAMIAGGLEEESDVIAQGLACATKVDPYVEPSPEGRQWLLEQWPTLEKVAIEVFREKWQKLSS